MAEFVQTMKDWQRMCNTIKSCDDCPMCKEDGWTYVLCSEGGISSARPEVAEKVIAKWAAEHPEPVYPTWGEWFVENGDLIDGWQNATNAAWMANTALDVFMKPIPADTAQKLEIEPKEDV